MAKLSPEIKATIEMLKEQLLDIIDEAKAVEFALLENFGETAETFHSLEQLTEITLQAESRFSQLSRLQIQVAESQPAIAPALFELLNEAIANLQRRIPALGRSIEEIKLDWSLQ